MALRSVLAATLASALIAGSSVAARADDGIGGFFQQLFGGAGGGSNQPLPQPDYGQSDSPPLTVRIKKHRRPSGAQLAGHSRYTPEELKNVTIFTDKTLMRGDAVMTAGGIRIFNGSNTWPYRKDDFVALSPSDKMPKTVRKELTAIDLAARSDFRGE